MFFSPGPSFFWNSTGSRRVHWSGWNAWSWDFFGESLSTKYIKVSISETKKTKIPEHSLSLSISLSGNIYIYNSVNLGISFLWAPSPQVTVKGDPLLREEIPMKQPPVQVSWVQGCRSDNKFRRSHHRVWTRSWLKKGSKEFPGNSNSKLTFFLPGDFIPCHGKLIHVTLGGHGVSTLPGRWQLCS